MRPTFLLVAALLPLAGCLDNGDDATTDDAPTGPAGLGPAALPEWDVTAAIDWWERFSTAFVKRDAYLPANGDARSHLVSELERIGMDVEVRSYPAALLLAGPVPEQVPLDIVAIVGTKTGTEMPDHRIGLVSHFDTQTLTIQGAYDDASGVASEFAICEALMQVELRRSVSCIFFDAEEVGLQASAAYVADVTEGDEDFVYDVVFGYDMTGINWPGHDWKMYLMTGGDEYVPLLGDFGRQVMHDEMGYPEEGVEVLDVHNRNSDERRFREAGIPIFRFAGGRTASDYPEYHMPGDTVEYVYDFVGGRPNFEAGFSTIVNGSLALVQAFDATDMEELEKKYGAA
ncbi:MAG: M28 family metallopeptidase [Thermoplasmatota archaeon]